MELHWVMKEPLPDILATTSPEQPAYTLPLESIASETGENGCGTCGRLMLKAYCGGVSALARNAIRVKTRKQASRMTEVWRKFISQSGLMRLRLPRNRTRVN